MSYQQTPPPHPPQNQDPERVTYQQARKFMQDTIDRLESEEGISIDDMVDVAKRFANAKKHCEDRLKAIQQGIADALTTSSNS